MKKQRIFWLDDKDYKLLLQKVEEQGFAGKGRVERFLELISREKIIIIKGSGKIVISVKS